MGGQSSAGAYLRTSEQDISIDLPQLRHSTVLGNSPSVNGPLASGEPGSPEELAPDIGVGEGLQIENLKAKGH